MSAAASSPARTSRRSVSLDRLLLSLPLLVLVPLLLYAAGLLYLMAGQARDATERDLVAANRALNAVIQREFALVETTLGLVTNSRAIGDAGVDAPAMEDMMERLARSDMGLRSFMLVDREGHVLAQYPRAGPERPTVTLGPHHRQVFDNGTVVVSNLHPSVLDGRMSLSVNLPVWNRGSLRWVLSARVDPEHLARLMATQLGQRDAVATLMDANRHIVARTREMARFMGMSPSAETMRALDDAPSGTRRLRTLDGNDYFWAWSVTPLQGWHVMFGIPARGVQLALRESMLRLGAVGLLLLLLGMGAALRVAGRIASSVDRMAASAPGLASGGELAPADTGIRQLDALYEALAAGGAQVQQALQDRDRALDAERQARAMADEGNRARDIFIATLSHELRNPLAPIRSAAMVVKSPRADPARRQWAAEVIERQATAMARLLDDLLDTSRIASGRIVLECRPTSLREVVADAVEVARPRIEARSHTLVVSLPAEEVPLTADPLRLSQVFANLLANAAKYTDPGGRIELTGQVHGNEVRVSVKDSGIGLDPQDLEQVFQMFAQVRSPQDRSEGGLGIGLSLVRGLVRLHGGWVQARSEGPGKGSEFVVGLPLRPA